jgi:hypothetical protein
VFFYDTTLRYGNVLPLGDQDLTVSESGLYMIQSSDSYCTDSLLYARATVTFPDTGKLYNTFYIFRVMFSIVTTIHPHLADPNTGFRLVTSGEGDDVVR